MAFYDSLTVFQSMVPYDLERLTMIMQSIHYMTENFNRMINEYYPADDEAIEILKKENSITNSMVYQFHNMLKSGDAWKDPFNLCEFVTTFESKFLHNFS